MACLLFISDNFFPESNAPALRTHQHARRWVDKGHDVTVITCAPNFPEGKVYPGYKNKLYSIEVIEGIRVVRVWSFLAPNSGVFLRLIDFISFMISATIAGLFLRRTDVVIGTSPQFFSVCAAFLISKAKRTKFVFEMRDIWPASTAAVGLRYASFLEFLAAPVARFLYRKADTIVVVTKSFKRYLESEGIVGDKIHFIPNGVDLSLFQSNPDKVQILQKLNVERKFFVGYIGTHGLAHDLLTIVNAAKLVKADPSLSNVQFITVGSGANFSAIKEATEQIDNFTMVGQVSHEESRQYWSILQLSIIHLSGAPMFRSVIPSKMFESFASGVPVLHGVHGESADIIDENKAGVCFVPQDACDLYQKIKSMHDNPEVLKELSANCLSAAKKYKRNDLADRMLEILLGTIG